MKKVALSLLALALVGSMAFGQDAAAPALKIGGYLDVGTNTAIRADSGAQTIIKGDDSGKAGGSYEFRGAYGTDKAGLVFNVRFENLAAVPGLTVSGSTGSLSGTIYDVQSAYTWFLLPGVDMVKIQAGNYNNDGTAWNAVDDKGVKATSGTGVAVQITPAEGFTFGGGVAPSSDGYTPPTYSVGATYTVPSTVLIQGAMVTANKAWVATVDGGYVGGKLLLEGPLSVKGDFNFSGMSASGSHIQTIDDFTIGYAVTDAFSAGLLTYIYTYGGDDKANNGVDAAALSAKINPSISYTVDPVTSLGFGGTYYIGNGAGIYPTTATTAPTLNKLTGIEINPNATFTIDANTKVYVNYLYDVLSGDDKPTKDASWSTVKVDFRYTF